MKIGPFTARRSVGGRLTPVFTKKFLAWLRVTPYRDVVRICGVHPKTVFRWRQKAGITGWTETGRQRCSEAAYEMNRKVGNKRL